MFFASCLQRENKYIETDNHMYDRWLYILILGILWVHAGLLQVMDWNMGIFFVFW